VSSRTVDSTGLVDLPFVAESGTPVRRVPGSDAWLPLLAAGSSSDDGDDLDAATVVTTRLPPCRDVGRHSVVHRLRQQDLTLVVPPL